MVLCHRGANITNILNFENTFAGTKVIKLEQNYRSTQTILNAANAVISNNIGRKAKSLWTENGEGEKVNYTLYENGYDEAQVINLKIECLAFVSLSVSIVESLKRVITS